MIVKKPFIKSIFFWVILNVVFIPNAAECYCDSERIEMFDARDAYNACLNRIKGKGGDYGDCEGLLDYYLSTIENYLNCLRMRYNRKCKNKTSPECERLKNLIQSFEKGLLQKKIDKYTRLLKECEERYPRRPSECDPIRKQLNECEKKYGEGSEKCNDLRKLLNECEKNQGTDPCEVYRRLLEKYKKELNDLENKAKYLRGKGGVHMNPDPQKKGAGVAEEGDRVRNSRPHQDDPAWTVPGK